MSLPAGFRVRLAPDVVSADQGRLLVGGSPVTGVRLSPRARRMLGPGGVTVTDRGTGLLAERLLATNLGLPELEGLPAAEPASVTVVIPVRDRARQLDRALAAVAPLRCLVVDDASYDATAVAEVVRHHGAELLSLPQNAGPAGARNAGLATVTTPYVAFVDSDVEVTATDLLRLTRHFADPAVCLVGPRVVGASRSPRPRWFERYDAVASSLTLGRRPCTVGPGAAVGWLPSACLVGRTEALAGGFDAGMRVGEDVDLVWRLVRAGHRVRFDPDVEARHETRPTVRAWLGRKAFYGYGGAGLAARHGNLLAPAVLTPAYGAAAAALLLRKRWSLPAAAGALAVGAWTVRRALPETPDRGVVAARLAARGLGWALRQESALLVRHWWPAAALGAAVHPGLRRALATALVVDSAVGLAEHRHPADPLNPLVLLTGRRLDDLAYGAGLWWGAVRARSARVLLPRRPRR